MRVGDDFYDLIAEHRHLLLLFGGVEMQQSALPDFLERNLGVYRVAAAEGSDGQLIDNQGAIAARYGAAPAAYVIRPDGYVGFRCGESQLPMQLQRYLDKIFTSVPAANLA